jgi:FtsP/CotA-like multicopper oxidase with cupredoxin domain
VQRAQVTPGLGVRDTVLPNDNRVAGGALRGNVLTLRLEARYAGWRPDLRVDSLVTVAAFAEAGGAPRIPGPLIRATSGTEVVASVRNGLPDSTLVVYGLRAGTVEHDTLQIPPGVTREVRFRASAPGTYLYYGSTTGLAMRERQYRDGQLTGAIVIDAPNARRDTAERVFVMTVVDIFPGDSVRNRKKEDIWELAINGRSWPHTERLATSVGDTVRWRWLNGSYLPHPMHLHGFHFRVLAKGNGFRDTLYADATRLAVTELMLPGSTFEMDWTPTRAGHWLMHCHMIPHITPFPERADTARAHDMHAVEDHPLSGMAGLVIGIVTVDRKGALHHAASAPNRHLRLLAQRARVDSGRKAPHGFVLQRGADPARDSVEVPGSPLVLTRGVTTAITVVNRLPEATTVHWHGLELESVHDGVAGWSRTASSIAPLIAPGDSFTVTITPPRAGTYMYHTHMDEGVQLGAGMYGAFIVLEPGAAYDPATDFTFMIGGAIHNDTVRNTLNGSLAPPPLTLSAGVPVRLRFANILFAPVAQIRLVADSVPLTWRGVAKDGAEYPLAAQRSGAAVIPRMGVGETYDMIWTPDRPMEALLEITVGPEREVLRQKIVVRP